VAHTAVRSTAPLAIAAVVFVVTIGLGGAAAAAPPGGAVTTPCQWTTGCFERGHCSPADASGRCAATSDADCAQSRGCRESGQCAFSAGRCVALGGALEPRDDEDDRAFDARVDATCAPTPACRDFGACGYVYDREGKRCAATPEGCRRSVLCRYAGMCGVGGQPDVDPDVHVELAAAECGATDPGVEAKAPACQREGLCGRSSAERRKACESSQACREDGRCGPNPTTEGGPTRHHADDAPCAARSDRDCQRSEGCKRWGRCAFDEHATCIADAADACRKSQACARYGACHLVGERCAVIEQPAKCPNGERLVVPSRVTASSVHKPIPASERFPGGYAFEPENVLDGDPRTSWQPATSRAGGVGEHLTFHFDEPTRIARIEVANGFLRADSLGDLFLANNRIREAVLRSGDDVVELLTFEPFFRGLASVPLDARPRTELRLEVLSHTRGWQWNDLAISQVRFVACRP